MHIEIDHLNKSFGTHHVLKDLSLHLDNCHSLVIVGPSGGGKTTLLRVIAGLEPADSGTIVVNGRAVESDEDSLREYRKHVGMVFQAYNLFPPPHRPREYHAAPSRKFTVGHRQRHGRRRWRCSIASSWRIITTRKPAQLSGGQKQRIALSRAIAIAPEFSRSGRANQRAGSGVHGGSAGHDRGTPGRGQTPHPGDP
jgi:polar amino acid transport system ATP-binding protein